MRATRCFRGTFYFIFIQRPKYLVKQVELRKPLGKEGVMPNIPTREDWNSSANTIERQEGMGGTFSYLLVWALG
jgi:hypothetical protein